MNYAIPVAAVLMLCAFPVEAMTDEGSEPSTARSGLPFARSETFATLDEYLSFLRKKSAMDIPYYRRLPDGRYERMTGRAQQGRRGAVYTREQLMQKFGFTR